MDSWRACLWHLLFTKCNFGLLTLKSIWHMCHFQGHTHLSTTNIKVPLSCTMAQLHYHILNLKSWDKSTHSLNIMCISVLKFAFSNIVWMEQIWIDSNWFKVWCDLVQYTLKHISKYEYAFNRCLQHSLLGIPVNGITEKAIYVCIITCIHALYNRMFSTHQNFLDNLFFLILTYLIVYHVYCCLHATLHIWFF